MEKSYPIVTLHQSYLLPSMRCITILICFLILPLSAQQSPSPSAHHPAKAPKRAPMASNDWITLFNGKDFTNWGGSGKTEHLGYRVIDGSIEATPKSAFLQTKQSFKNYILDLEFQLTAGANNGIGIHYPGSGDPAATGMEIQVLDNTAEKYKHLKDWQFHGSLYKFTAAKRGHLKPIGEWNQQRIIVSGDMVSVILNGTLVTSASLSEALLKHPDHTGVKRREGAIVFCGHGDIVRYKNVKILPF